MSQLTASKEKGAKTEDAAQSSVKSRNPARQIIDAIGDAPVGQLISVPGGDMEIPPSWREDYAVMRSEGRTLLLTTLQGRGKPRMFELQKRMRAADMRSISLVTLTPDILSVIYSQAQSRERHEAVTGTSVEKLADEIVRNAAHRGASDIHIEAGREYARVLYRINGIRQFARDLTQVNAKNLGAVLYNVYADPGSKAVSWSPDEIMDGGVEWPDETTGKKYQLRFSSGPIYQGFQIVIRLLLMDSKSGTRLDALGYTKEQYELIEDMASGSSGMVIMCGPTNSGKSTSLRAMISQLYEERGDAIKIITVEDPVEYVIPGACQVPVGRRGNRGADSNGKQDSEVFTNFLRGTLRQDPDVVMAGEIRDASSASVVKDIVLAGRKLFTTLHTYSALWSYTRLREMGVPWELLTMPGFIAGIVYQRLVPKLCPHCSIPLNKGGGERLSVGTARRLRTVIKKDDYAGVRVQGDGCEHCENTGYTGRTVCAEIVVPDRQLLGYLASGDLLGAERYWHASGTGASPGQEGITALAHAITKMKEGVLSPHDIEQNITVLSNEADLGLPPKLDGGK